MTKLPSSPIVNKDLVALLAGTRLSDDREFLDVEEGSSLRDSQDIISYKGGFGTIALVYNCEVPR
jgi:hypothetical protein